MALAKYSMTKRIKNLKLCGTIRELPCQACHSSSLVECHHIVTRARQGPDLEWNLMPLCVYCHRYWHDQGKSEFFRKFPAMIRDLLDRGFFWDDHFKKLIPPKF